MTQVALIASPEPSHNMSALLIAFERLTLVLVKTVLLKLQITKFQPLDNERQIYLSNDLF